MSPRLLTALTVLLLVAPSIANAQTLIQGEVAGGPGGNGAPGSAKTVSVEPDGTVRTKSMTAGTTGTDYSANAATVSGTPLLIIPATATRAYVEVQNQSAAQLQLVRDDGAGNQVTSILIAAGSGANSQGGSWSSSTFKGRVRVYGPAGSQVGAYQD